MRRLFSGIQQNLLVLLILIIALVVRIYGNGFGLPDQFHIDEVHLVSRAIKFGSGDLNPHFFFYPTFYMYFLFVLYGITFLAGTIGGVYKSASEFGMQYFIDPSIFYLIGRTFSALFGVATVYVVYIFGKKFVGKSAGVAAAVMLGASTLHIELSHYTTTDIPLTFFITLALYFITCISVSGERKYYLLAGVAGGLAISTKYTAALLLPVMLLSHFVYVYSSRKMNRKAAFLNLDLFIMFILFAIVFVAASPFIVLDFKSFVNDIGIQQKLMQQGWLGDEVPVNMWIHSISVYLKDGLGVPVLLCGLLGVVYCFVRRKIELLSVSVFFVCYYLFVGRYSNWVYARHWIGVFPALCICSAYLLNDLFRLSKLPERIRLDAVSITAMIMVIAPFNAALNHDALLTVKDTRTISREWIEDNIPTGTTIAIEFACPQLKPTVESLKNKERAIRLSAKHNDFAAPYNVYSERKVSEAEAASEKNIHTKALERVSKKYNLIYAYSLSEYSLDVYSSEGAEYLIISGAVFERYFNAEKNYPESVEFYRSLDRDMVMVKEFTAAPGVSTGPTIRIYKFKN